MDKKIYKVDLENKQLKVEEVEEEFDDGFDSENFEETQTVEPQNLNDVKDTHEIVSIKINKK